MRRNVPHLALSFALFGGFAANPAFAADLECLDLFRPAEEVIALRKVRANDYMDVRGQRWVEDRKCVSCHTVLPYALGRMDPGTLNTNSFKAIDRMITKRVETFATSQPWYAEKAFESKATESVLNALIMTQSDQLRGLAEASELTRKAFSQMREMQGPDGSWQWLDYSLQPWESYQATSYGATLAAVALGRSKAATLPENVQMVAKLKQYFASADASNASNLWNRVSILWAEAEMGSVLPVNRVEAIVGDMLDKQLPDGGWSMNHLGNWQKHGSSAAAGADASDGYATAYLLYVMKRLNAAGKIPSAQAQSFQNAYKRGVEWLLENQTAEGKWVSASLNRDRAMNHTFVEDAATGFGLAVLRE